MRSLSIIIIIFVMSFAYTAYPSFAQQQACDYKVEILLDKEEFEIQDFKWRMKATKIEGKSTNITGTAEIKDSDGKTAKSYKPWTSDSIAKQKTSSEYSPNLKPGSYEITAEINVDCDDSNKDNNADKKEIKINGEIGAANSRKSKTSETKNGNAVADDVDNGQINPDLQNTATTKTKKPAAIDELDNTIELKQQNTNKNAQSQPITSNTIQSQKPQTAYESSNEKIKGLIMVFLLTLSILLNVILIWKR